MKLSNILLIIFILIVPVSFATDEYKPYLHKASVPEHPEVTLYGQYSTNLFLGAATYSYPIETPKGINGFQPQIVISYNSQSKSPSILGQGWNINQDLIYRDINNTPSDTSDDFYKMILDSTPYELKYSAGDSRYHTEVEYHFKIEQFSTYWLVTKKNGVKYKFSYKLDGDYTLKWFLTEIGDTHENKIYYTYTESDNFVYVDKIEYNSDKSKLIQFNYESRSDTRINYDEELEVKLDKRLSSISVYNDDSLIDNYNFNYEGISSLSTIENYGRDNTKLYDITFDYFQPETGYNNQSGWILPVTFSDSTSDYGVRLLDVNNDGFIDIVQGTDTDKKVWINNKVDSWDLSSWVFPEIIVSSNKDQGVRFADINRDGFQDILVSRTGVDKKVYLNDGTGWTESTISLPVDFVDATGLDQGVRIVDLNADGFVDIIKSKSGTRQVYIGDGDSWTPESSWTIPEDFYSTTDLGVRLVDLNGDGLVDLAKGYSGTREAWLNTGSNFTPFSTFTAPVDFVTSSKLDNGVRFADVNNDGLVDIMEDFANGTSTSKGAWINDGTGWNYDSSWISPEAFTKNGYNQGRRLADVNGDGFVDVVVSHDTTKYTQVKNNTIPYMLKAIKNEYGGITKLNYTKSTQFDNTENGISQIGFNIFVISDLNLNNSLTGDFEVLSLTEYNYSKGKYNYENSEFRGFGQATEFNLNSIVEHNFYQDSPRRGKEYTTSIYDDNWNLYSRNTKNYNYTSNYGIYNISLKNSADYLYDGSAVAKITNKSYEYDSHENLKSIVDYGDISVTGDEKYYTYEYAVNPTSWIMDRVARVSVFDSFNSKVKETKYYYDNVGHFGVISKGDLTKVEEWNNGNNVFTYYTYDSYGNVIKKHDSYGNSYTYQYDKTNTYLAMSINPIGHMVEYEYDSNGNVISQESNNILTYFEYDEFGRKTKEISPYDSVSLPTKEYEYSFDGVAPESVKVSAKVFGGESQDTTYYYDGFANLIQIKSDTEDSQIVKNIYYDSEFKVSSEDNPYFDNYTSNLSTPLSSPSISYEYDAMGRVIKVTNPDGTNKTVEFDKWNITDYDENGNRHKYVLDGFGRIVKVFEYNDNLLDIEEEYETNYEYDTNNNLVKITDNEGNEFEFEYDALGRKVSMNDPDLGYWTYQYDLNGNLINQTGGKGNLISGDGYFREYNELNQLVKVYNGSNSSGVLLQEYTYHPIRERIIKKVSYHSNRTIMETVYYPFKDFVQVINSSGTYEYTYIYHNNQMIAQINPDGTKTYTHTDHLGSSTEITNSSGQLLEQTSYSPFGEIISGGKTSRFDYEGKEYDDVVKNIDFNFRKYNPEWRLFTQPDVVIQNKYDPQTLNRYAFERNNPYLYVDESGNVFWVPLAVGGIFGIIDGTLHYYNNPGDLSGAITHGAITAIGTAASIYAPVTATASGGLRVIKGATIASRLFATGAMESLAHDAVDGNLNKPSTYFEAFVNGAVNRYSPKVLQNLHSPGLTNYKPGWFFPSATSSVSMINQFYSDMISSSVTSLVNKGADKLFDTADKTSRGSSWSYWDFNKIYQNSRGSSDNFGEIKSSTGICGVTMSCA